MDWTCALFVPFQSTTETAIKKLKEKIQQTKDQLSQLYPKYDEERRNEEQAASQLVAFSVRLPLDLCFHALGYV